MLKRISAGLLASAAAVVFMATLAHALLYSPDTDLVAENPDAFGGTHIAVPAGFPTRLVIPTLHIDANVQYVGITKHGTMSVPNNFTDVGWYRYGVLPGQSGSAVMAGHVDNALALPGVFKHLGDIQKGADVYARTKEGGELHFTVDDVETYNVNDAPAARIFDTGGAPRLTLITCEGTWMQSQHQYDHRLVVYTHLVGAISPKPQVRDTAPAQESFQPPAQPQLPDQPAPTDDSETSTTSPPEIDRTPAPAEESVSSSSVLDTGIDSLASSTGIGD